jgi:hypothetical protein
MKKTKFLGDWKNMILPFLNEDFLRIELISLDFQQMILEI